jgi:hypothetical protein
LCLKADKANQERQAVEALGLKKTQVETLSKQCLIGYGKMDIVEGPVKLKFGVYNYRPLSVTQGNLIYSSMVTQGVQRFSVENAIPLIIPRGYVDETSLMKDAELLDKLPVVKWTEEATGAKEVVAAGGRHRLYTVQKLRNAADVTLKKAVKESTSGKKEKPDHVKAALVRQLADTHALLQTLLMWMVGLYNEGASALWRS